MPGWAGQAALGCGARTPKGGEQTAGYTGQQVGSRESHRLDSHLGGF